jgi:hypothetical protein
MLPCENACVYCETRGGVVLDRCIYGSRNKEKGMKTHTENAK